MEKFRVALSADFVCAGGTPAFPDFDLSPLDDEPRIDWSYVPVADGRGNASDMIGIDALILLAGQFTPASFPGDDRLSVVARFGVGYDNVDVPACDANNVALVITPSGVRRPVAVAIMTFVLALSGRLLTKDALTRAGPDGWAKRGQHMGQGLVGLTLGSIGVGNIGAELFRLAAPFGMKFIAYDPYVEASVATDLGVSLTSLEGVFRQSDFVNVSCPLTDDTRGLVDAERLALMKPTAFLINTARGPIVDQTALTEALVNKRIAGAGLDVFEDEPSAAEDALFGLPNVIVTPHSLCWTDQCFAENCAADIRAVCDVMTGNVPEGIVNRGVTSNHRWTAKLADFRKRFA